MFLYVDETVIKWLQWGVRQVELFMGIRQRFLFRCLAFLYVAGVFVYVAWFAIYFSLLGAPLFVFMHAVAAAFFTTKLIRLWPVMKIWFGLSTSCQLRTARRIARLTLLVQLIGVAAVIFGTMFEYPLLFRFLFVWLLGFVLLFILLLSLEYMLCTESVPLDELIRRQKLKH